MVSEDGIAAQEMMGRPEGMALGREIERLYHMGKRIGKNDLILIGALFLVAAMLYLAGNRIYGKSGMAVRVTKDGEEYGTYDLGKEQTVSIQEGEVTTNILQISSRKANMIAADCPDQLCVHQKEISQIGETIVCLPNKIVVEVIGNEK